MCLLFEYMVARQSYGNTAVRSVQQNMHYVRTTLRCWFPHFWENEIVKDERMTDMQISRRRFLALTAALGAVALVHGVDLPIAMAAKEDDVVNVAKRYNGSTNYYNYCLKLANDIYERAGYRFKRYGSAIQAATAMRKKIQPTNSKKGALMFWDARNGSRPYGHVAIYLGDNKVLTSWTAWGGYSTGNKVSIVSRDTMLNKIPGFMGYVHIGDAITFR